jgi:hypothetical protein
MIWQRHRPAQLSYPHTLGKIPTNGMDSADEIGQMAIG